MVKQPSDDLKRRASTLEQDNKKLYKQVKSNEKELELLQE